MPVLHWLDRLNTTPKVPCRVLRVDENLSCGEADSGNMLVQGDDLHTLESAAADFSWGSEMRVYRPAVQHQKRV